MQRRDHREAAFPDEPLRFEVSPDPGCAETDIHWAGGGNPATGVGRRFETVFPGGGTFVVTARCGDAVIEFPFAVCEVNVWLARAASFFGPSVDLSKVTVKTSRMVLGPAGMAWTCNNVIRFKRPTRAHEMPAEATFIHELGHVWEHQAGQAQLLNGIVEQIAARFGRDPYDFGGPHGVRIAQTLSEFSKESQAQIIAELWKSEHGAERDRKNVPFSTPGYVEDLRRLVAGAGIGTRSSRTRTLAGSIDAGVARVLNGFVDLLS